MASTNNMCINEPTASPNPKKPTSHPIIKITTINQIKSLIINVFNVSSIKLLNMCRAISLIKKSLIVKVFLKFSIT